MANQYTIQWPDAFWKKVRKTPSCWIWQGSVNMHGYGQLSHNGRAWKAHRLSYKMEYGEVDESLYVCHKCDSPPCVNPSHLFLGTQKANMMDLVNKKGHGRGQLDLPTYKQWLLDRPRKTMSDKCRRGHFFSEENTRIKKRGRFLVRICRICQHNTASRDRTTYKVKGFVRNVPNRAEVVESLVEKIKLLGECCAYCGGEFECLDHIVPKSCGGGISAANINPSCNDCNQSRKKLF